MLAALLAAFLTISTGADAAPVVVEDVDLISVAHYPHEGEYGLTSCAIVCFWSRAAGEWHLLAKRYDPSESAIALVNSRWQMQFRDDVDGCYRAVRTDEFLEEWLADNPLAADRDKPWFAQLCEPGLKPPK